MLAPAIEAAETGYPVTERVARDWAKQVGKLARNRAAAAGVSCSTAQRRCPARSIASLRLPALRSIAAEGPAAFYEGWIARDMVETLRALGGLHTLDDFASFAPEYVTPRVPVIAAIVCGNARPMGKASRRC